MVKEYTKIPQLRIVVNTRCERACIYCRPSGEGLSTQVGSEISPDIVYKVSAAFVELGGTFIKLTGGEPALWGALADCVCELKQGIKVPVLHVISRHPAIGEIAPTLAKAGLDLINISLDTLDKKLHHEITGVDDLYLVQKTIEKCASLGIPMKVNTVVMSGINDKEIFHIIEYCEKIGVTCIKLMDVIADLHDGQASFKQRLFKLKGIKLNMLYQSLAPVVDQFRNRAIKTHIQTQGGLGHPMVTLTMPSGLDVVVKDHNTGAWRGSICNNCDFYPCHDALMALRLTPEAFLQFCLLREDIAVDLGDSLNDNPGQLKKLLGDALEVYNSARFHKEEIAN
jgi:cyclic pyranopterin phosphate synthase